MKNIANRKNKLGITLIALVITVIIMLILAGVAISSLTNSDGLFSKIKNAKEVYDTAATQEKEDYDNIYKMLEESLDDGKNVFPSAPHPDQEVGNDIGMGTDGKVVNLDLWNYTFIDEDGNVTNNEENIVGVALKGAEVGSGSYNSAYSNSEIVNGKIKGTVPKSIKHNDKIYNVINMVYAFAGCTNLIEAPVIPDTVKNLACAFEACINLEVASDIPREVENMPYLFFHCYNLSGSVNVYAIPTNYYRCFVGVNGLTINAYSSIIDELANENGGITGSTIKGITLD